MPKGLKLCSRCHYDNPPAAHTCRVCGNPFVKKNGELFPPKPTHEVISGISLSVEVTKRGNVDTTVESFGRGHKVCSECCAINGARSLYCRACGAGFIVKGVRQPDVDISAVKLVKEKDKDKLPEQLRKLVDEAFTEVANDIRQNFGYSAKVYLSSCGKYRINFGQYFQGIKVDSPYKLLRLSDNGFWELADGKYRFDTYLEAVQSYIKRVKGIDIGSGKKQHPKLAKAKRTINKAKKQMMGKRRRSVKV